MNNRVLSIGLSVIVGIMVGVAIAVQAANSTMDQAKLSQQLSRIMGEQSKVNERLTGIEGKVDTMLKIFNETRQVAQRMQQQQGQRQQAQMPPQEDLSKVYDIPLEKSYVRGKKDAKVTIVEFVDFQCPFCGRFYPPILEVLKAYPNDVNYVVKNYPLSFHPMARPGAKAALAAGEQGKYWEMVDLILANQQSLSEDKFKEWAGQIGINVDRFLKDYKDKDAQWEDILNKDMALGGQVGVQGTPSFYMNGKKTNARDLNSLKAEIDAILKGG